MEKGYLQLFRWRSTPVRAHWTVPIGALLFTGLAFAPVAWLAFFAVILLHEMGHALVARHYGHRVSSIELTGFGGLCRWSGLATDYERSAIAWGGVLAQAALFVVTLVVVSVFGMPQGALGDLAYVFLRTNAWIIALNLLPIPPLDGAEAWKIVRWLPRRVRRSKLLDLPARVVASLRATWTKLTRRSPREPAVGTKRPGSTPPPAPNPELAELLRRLGDEAKAARRSR